MSESAEILAAAKKLDELYGKLKRARDFGEDYTLDTVAEPLMVTMKLVAMIAMRAARRGEAP